MVIGRFLTGLSIPKFPFDLAAYGLFNALLSGPLGTYVIRLLSFLLTCQLAPIHFYCSNRRVLFTLTWHRAVRTTVKEPLQAPRHFWSVEPSLADKSL